MLETATSSATFLVGCFVILLTWNTVCSFFVIGVTVLYCLDSCESVVCLAPYYCLLLSNSFPFLEPSLLPYRYLVLDQFAVSLIDLNLVSPQ